jgi:hypothetical protein
MAKSIWHTFFDLIRMLIVTLFKLLFMAFALLSKVTGMILLKIGETIEKMISK